MFFRLRLCEDLFFSKKSHCNLVRRARHTTHKVNENCHTLTEKDSKCPFSFLLLVDVSVDVSDQHLFHFY
jgi:hypothetical protein